mgnify:CR=1 FL=1
MLELLEVGLPVGFDLFHNVDWSSTVEGRQQIGEIDIAVVSSLGHLLLIEVKSGALEEGESGLSKRYAKRDEALDVGRQLRRQHGAILSRLTDEGLRQVRIGTLLVLPDHRVASSSVAHQSDRIVDADGYPGLCRRVLELMPHDPLPDDTRQRLVDFLANRFKVLPDVSSRVGQIVRTSTALSSGLATWIPAVEHESGLFVIEATAGSGKTQLALALMRQAHVAQQRCAYVCFNRALAEDFDYRCKQAGQLASKMRFLSAPWVGILENDAWLKYARHANHCAQLLAELVSDIPGVELMFPVQANGVFLQLSEPAIAALTAKGWRFYTFIGKGGARFMCSWDTEEERVRELAADIREVMGA